MEIKVAIFEDNKMLRESLQQLINNQEDMYCTGAFSDANRLLRNMQLANPDAVLMDINMPGISGIEAVQIIKEKFPQVQILMQTVFEENDKIFSGNGMNTLKKRASELNGDYKITSNINEGTTIQLKFKIT